MNQSVELNLSCHVKLIFLGPGTLEVKNIISGSKTLISKVQFPLLHSYFPGLGHGLLLCPVTTLLSQYFEKRRSFANGLAVTGASVGSLVYSVIIRIFIESFAFTGMMMILGGISLQILVCSTLMRPRSYYSSRVSFDVGVSNDKEVTKTSCNGWQKINNNNSRNAIDGSNKTAKEDVEEVSVPIVIDVEDIQNGLLSNGVQSTNCLEKNQDNVEISANIVSPLLGPRLLRKERSDSSTSNKHPLEKTKTGLVSKIGSSLSALSSSNIGRFASTDLSMSSSLDIAGSFVKVNNHLEDGDSKGSDVGDINEVNPRTCAICDFSVLKRWSFLCFLPCAAFIITISTIPMFLPPYAIDSGLSSKESDFIITLISITEIVGTITWGLIADKGIIQRHKIITISACSAGIATFLAPLFRSEATFLAYSVWYGFFGRVYFGLYPIVLVDFLGLENLGPALGIASVIQTASNAIMQPVVGKLTATLIVCLQTHKFVCHLSSFRWAHVRIWQMVKTKKENYVVYVCIV